MSKYKRIATQFKDRECLLEALKRADVPFEVAQKGRQLSLYGYQGDRRKETAEFVVRRQHIGSVSNDLGYTWNAQAGVYEAIVSEYDTRCAATTEIRRKIKQQYAVSKVVKEARRKGLRVVQQRNEQGQIRLVLQGYAR
jgi:ABC-type molybdenum transport system ATPase subunit/photorepair protein PhrA